MSPKEILDSVLQDTALSFREARLIAWVPRQLTVQTPFKRATLTVWVPQRLTVQIPVEVSHV
jgi:hypothetical protein